MNPARALEIQANLRNCASRSRAIFSECFIINKRGPHAVFFKAGIATLGEF